MSGPATVHTQTAAKPAITPVAGHVLQRQCACGQHTSAGGECEECKKKREGMLQRAAINAAPVSEVPPIVHEVLRSPGQPLDTATRAFMEPRLGHDFSGVRIHTDAQSAKSARAVNALAYTVGQDVAFGTGQFAPGTSAGRKLIAHELTHVVQQERTRQTLAPSLEVGAANGRSEIEATVAAERLQAGSTINFVSPLSIPLLQRSPNEKGSTEGKGGELNPYEEEQEVIRYAIGARESGKLANGVVLYNAKYWRAAAISDSAFYVGPFTSDMGNFYYVYRFIGSDEKTSTYTLSRSTYLPGRDTKDLEASLARVQGGKTLEFKTTGLIPPSGGAVAKAVKKEASKGDEGKKVGGEGASKPEDAEDVQVLTPQRKKWLTAGRENMKHEIIALFNEIQKVKAARIGTWEKNANIKDPKPIRAALEVAIEIVGYGMGGVVGGYLTHAMAHGLAQEFAKEALLKSTVKLAEFLFEHAVEPAEEFLAEETEKALKENGKGNAVGALASKSSLLDCYVEAMTLQSLSEERVQTREFNANVDKKYTDLDLADTVIVFEKLWQILFNEPKAFLRELSEGLIRLKDEMYVQEKAKEYGGDVEKALRKDDDIVATDRRSGNLLMVVDGMAGGNELSYWYNPTFNFSGFVGLSTGVNKATLAELNGTPVKDLPFTLGFRFWAWNPFSGLFVDPLCQVWFTRRPDGTIWVDLDEPRNSDGHEWLASYYLSTSRELSESERDNNAPNGALKVYEHIKDKPLNRAEDFDIF